jgi:amidase
MTKKALEAAGHRVVEWKAYEHREMNRTVIGIWNAGSKEDMVATVSPSGEPILPSMHLDEPTPSSPPTLDTPDPSSLSAYQLWQLNVKKRQLRQDHLSLWERTSSQTGTGRPIDAILAPVSASAAPPHGKNKSGAYTMVFNLLDYAVVTVPVTKVDQVLDAAEAREKRETFFGSADKENHKWYGPKLFENAPVGIQVVGRTLEEEAVLGMGEIVDNALRAYSKPKL